MSAAIETGAPHEVKKYQTYFINVDPDDNDKATEIKLCSFARPHMRAFHCSWWAFFIAFFIWFAVAPILPEIKKTLGLTKQQLWNSNIIGVGGTIFMRFLLGPGCDKFGARILFALVLCTASIPTSMVGLANNPTSLYLLRLFIGIAGGSFVMCQYWTSTMFTKEVVGVANGIVAGWGNLGGGVTQLVVGSALFPLFKSLYDNGVLTSNEVAEKAWRTVCIVPAIVAFSTGVIMYFISDDAPKGNYAEMKKNGTMPEISAASSFRAGALNLNTWILFAQYAACFGVELTMNNAAATYFKEEFNQSTESAAAIASIFGWMNLFARGMGGYLSDKANARMGMRGRLIVQTVCLVCEGALVLIFANSANLASAIVIMVFFSIFVQACEGATFGIVPYVDPPATGSISGIVGAGGNVGAVCFGLAFRQLSYHDAFYIMGFCIIGSGLLSALIFIKGHSGLIWGQDSVETFKDVTLTTPQYDNSSALKEIVVDSPHPAPTKKAMIDYDSDDDEMEAEA